MSGRSDLTSLFAPTAPAEPFRQGVIVAFDPATGANQVSVGGAVLVDLPILVGGDTVNFAPGDVVILLKYRSSWAIFGRIVVPGSDALTATAVSFAGGGASSGAFTITSSFSTPAEVNVPTPVWANSLVLYAISTVIVSNTSGASELARLITDINGAGGGETLQQCLDSNYVTTFAPVARVLGAGGGFPLSATTNVAVRPRSNGATMSGIAAFLNYIAIFRKV